MNVDFVLSYCGFILTVFLYLYSDDLEIVLFAVCTSLHEPFLVWTVVKGRQVSVTLVKVKVYFGG